MSFLRIGVALALVFGPACSAHAADCSRPLPADYVQGGAHCLGIRIYGDAPAGTARVLVVALHGDTSRGGATETQHGIARRVAGPGVVGVGMLRPGYFDPQGRRSEGSDNGRGVTFTPNNVDSVAAGIRTLKEHYRPAKVILVGHSGGAATAGIILGRYPGLADGAVLVSCVCNTETMVKWQRWVGVTDSPHQFAKTLAKNVRVVAMTGDRDTVTPPSNAESYVRSLKSNGIDAEFMLVPGEGHDLNNAFLDRVAIVTTSLAR